MWKDPDRLFLRFRKTGDPRALAWLFDEVAPKLVAVARHLVGNAADAEDVVQATFLVAIEKAARFDGKRPVLPWLIGILSRQAGLVRRAQRKPDPDRMLERESGREAVDPTARIEQGELRSAVQHALEKLPAPYDEVLTIHLSEGEAAEEIARRLGRRPATVRVQLHRGLKLLRRVLPAGLTAGLTLSAGAPRGLACIKSEVLEHLALHPVAPLGSAAAVGSSSAALIGGITMSKGLIVAGGGLALAVGFTLFKLESPPRAELARAEAAAPERRPEPAPPTPSVVRPELPAPAREAQGPTAPERKELEQTRVERESAPVAPTSERAPLSIDVSGRVVDGTSEDALAGAVVWVYLEKEADQGEEQRSVPLRVETAADGSFRFTGLERHLVSLFVAADGFVRTSVTEWHVPELRKHERGLLDVGTIELERGATVSGRVRADGPVVGGQVFQYQHYREAQPAREDSVWAWEAAAVQDGGKYTLPMRVGYTDRGVIEHGLIVRTEQGLGWTSFELLEGTADHTEVDLEVHPGARLQVEVVDSRGRGIPGAEVEVDPRFDPFSYLGNPPERWTGETEALAALFRGRTDADGMLELDQLPLPLPGYGPPEHRAPLYVIEAVHAASGERARQVVELGPGRNTLRLELGRRELVVLSGYVRNDLGEPLADAWVRVAESATPGSAVSPASSGSPGATSAGSGAFRLEFDRPAAGRLLLEVGAADFGTRREELDVGPEESFLSVDFTLLRALPLAGIVVDEEDRPVVRAYVGIYRREENEEQGRSYSMQTGADGLFRFEHASQGDWRVNVSPPFQEKEWGGMRSVTVAGGDEDVRVVLQREPEGGTRVVARVFDAASGTALDPEDVTMMESGGISADFQDFIHDTRRVAGGALVEDVRPGQWRLWVRAAGHVPGYADFEVHAEDEEVRLRIELGGPSSLRGQVLGYEQLTYPGHASLTLHGSLNQPTYGAWATEAVSHGNVELAQDGSFAFEGLRPGKYSVRVAHGYELAERVVEVRPDEVARAELRFRTGGWLTLIGEEPEQEGFIRFQLFAQDGLSATRVHHAQREEGRFRSGFLVLPGTYRWKARFRPAETPTSEPAFEAEGSVTVAEGEQNEVWVELPR